ncbi:transporter [Photobacterium lipolyticum]|uniref:Transporter n=2 Tax=Photobacterium lipolyticum TaxID=266810 RepID=A0A2T3MVK4_9GAMM|nr:helix-hairpin-helix domain-containing protein [Photobacterium lipolyticum]PSW03914.1 transporter [Photobacterium lipolyticum]
MKNIVKAVVFCAAVVFAPMGSAAGGEHEGIEITVNINQANAEELDKLLIGIGPEKADNIIAYREANGNFETADDLQLVKGIGASTVEKNRQRIKL